MSIIKGSYSGRRFWSNGNENSDDHVQSYLQPLEQQLLLEINPAMEEHLLRVRY